MDANSDTTRQRLALPAWQIVVVLVGFPLLYLANCFTPWSYRLFVESDHQYSLAFGVSVVTLHWASVAVAVWFVWRAGGQLGDIGFHMGPLGFATFVGVVVLVGIAFIGLRGTWPPADLSEPQSWQMLYPWTQAERKFGIFLYVSAGFCEELVYRGFAIRVLQARGMKAWQATLLSSLSFVFIHGIGALFMFPFLFVAGILFALLFLWCKRLAPGMYIHSLLDMMSLLAV